MRSLSKGEMTVRSWDLLDRLARPDESRSLADRTLDAVLAFSNGRCAALFSREQERIVLLTSQGIHQAAIDLAGRVWADERAELQLGKGFESTAPNGNGCCAVVPVMGQGARLLGLLYVETEEDRFHDRRDMEALAQFCGIAGLALGDPKEPLPSRGVESYLERTPADEVEREQLLVLLERNEWNIARVSRLLGITRPTVYKRLQRFGIERRRVPKTLARRQLAASRPSYR